MYSWKLFAQTMLGNELYRNPVYLRELKHVPIWYRLARNVTLPDMFQTGIGVTVVLVWGIAVLFVGNLLFFFVPPLILLMFMTALTVGPLIVEERVKYSWETLLMIPVGLDVVLIGKIAGALWWTRHLISIVIALVFMTSAGVGFISLVLIPVGLPIAANFQQIFLCGSLILLPLLSCTIFILDRVQQYMLIVASALSAGTLSSSVRGAFTSASVAAILVWMLEVLVAGTLLALRPGAALMLSKARLLLLMTTGPTVSFVIDLPIDVAALYLVIIWCMREISFRVLWRVSMRSAGFDATISG